MPNLVALYSSTAQSGKSETARVFEYQYGYQVVKFAGPLKSMARAFLDSMGFNKSEIEQMVEGKLKEQVIPGFLSVTPRMVMQTIGLEWGREAIDLDVWVNTAKRKIETLMSQGYSVIIDDMRFLNEFLMVKEIGGTTVRLTRASAPKLAGNHASEGALDNEEFDHYISNDGDLEELYFKARMLAQGLGSTKKVYA